MVPRAAGIALKVWQAVQPLVVKVFTAPAAAAAPLGAVGAGVEPPAGGGVVERYHFAQSTWLITTAVLRIRECPRPQSSIQITGNVPSRLGVITRLFSWPGTASCFWANCGTQKEWITSFEVMISRTPRSIGRCRSA